MKEHATELHEKVEYRLKESYCVEPGCEYQGKPAVQGHCYHRPEDYVTRYITRLHQRAEEALQWERDLAKSPEEYLKRLESMFVWATVSQESTLDSLIRLRRDNAALKARVDALEQQEAP